MKNTNIHRHHRTVVRLGTHANRFAIAQTGLRILGSIQTGLEIGALAQLPDGTYLQVNGDTHRVLHTACIEAAIARAVRRLAAQPETARPPDDAGPADAPVIVYKQRRRASEQPSQQGPMSARAVHGASGFNLRPR
jgi:hypothetical protein